MLLAWAERDWIISKERVNEHGQRERRNTIVTAIPGQPRARMVRIPNRTLAQLRRR
jgi:hypothetical protein